MLRRQTTKPGRSKPKYSRPTCKICSYLCGTSRHITYSLQRKQKNLQCKTQQVNLHPALYTVSRKTFEPHLLSGFQLRFYHLHLFYPHRSFMHGFTACITSCIKYLINRIFNTLRYNIIIVVWHSYLSKEN